MTGDAQRPFGDRRQTSRRGVDVSVLGEHRRLGDTLLHIANISPSGFMIRGEVDLGKGERITVRLPAIGRIEAFVLWNDGARAGFQFERVLRQDDFGAMIEALPEKRSL